MAHRRVDVMVDLKVISMAAMKEFLKVVRLVACKVVSKAGHLESRLDMSLVEWKVGKTDGNSAVEKAEWSVYCMAA